MNLHVRAAVAGLIVIGSLGGPRIAAFQEEVTMRYLWSMGETLRYRMTQQGTTTMSGMPGMGEVSVDQSMTQVFKTVVQEVAADGTTTLQQVLESVKMNVTSPMGTLAFDSATPDTSGNPATRVLGSVMAGMIGEPFTMMLSPTGAVQKVDGFSRLLEKMMSSMPQDPAGAASMNAMKQSFTDEAMQGMMAQGFAQFPPRPVKPGESWSHHVTINNPMMGGYSMSIVATLKAIEGSAAERVARIDTQLTIKQDPDAPAAPNPMGMNMKIGESTGEGEIQFDATNGRLVRSIMRMTLPMTISGPGPGGAENMKMNVKSTQTVVLVQ